MGMIFPKLKKCNWCIWHGWVRLDLGLILINIRFPQQLFFPNIYKEIDSILFLR